MDPNQQQLLLSYGGKKSTYLDDVFSTQVWVGNNSAGRSIDVGIDMAGEGGMTWIKRRNATEVHCINDTVRGAGKYLQSNGTAGETNDPNRLTSFTDTGFTVGNDTCTNSSNNPYVGWNFRKAPGFFDVVTYTGNGSNRTIAHNLESVPGCVMVKRYDGNEDWAVWHRGPTDINTSNTMTLNGDGGASADAIYFNSTAPTATHFTVGTSNRVNGNGNTYVAYIFGGGTSPSAAAKSVEFDGSNDYLNIAGNSDFDVETNWTAECWFKCDLIGGNGYDVIMGCWTGGTEWLIEYVGSSPISDLRFYWAGGNKSLGSLQTGGWHHVAVSKQGSTTRIFVDGLQTTDDFDMGTIDSSASFQVGSISSGSGPFNGKISNVRIVKGTAVYTAPFIPPTEPLTNISGTVLLCCNSSTPGGATVTPSTIGVGGAQASIDNPFDDPEGFKFGEDEDKGIIRCGSYSGNANANGPDIYLGWEPLWILVKPINYGDTWYICDTTRRMTGDGFVELLMPSNSNAGALADRFAAKPTGFKITHDDNGVNRSNMKLLYIAIRRPDGWVGKPPELGTDVMGLGTRSGSGSNALSNVNVFADFSLIKRYNNGGEYWAANARLMGHYSVKTNDSNGNLTGALPSSGAVWDYDKGHLVAASNGATNTGSDIMDWGWKRHAGFDVVSYDGTGTGMIRQIPHSLSKVPEMIWIKNRNASQYWAVGHKDLNGGTNPWNYALAINTTGAENANLQWWLNTPPTSSVFTVGDDGRVNAGQSYIAMLFASVAGISKVGKYTSTNPASTITVTTGFSPRFVLIKRCDATEEWAIYDTVRGWGAGNDAWITPQSTSAQNTNMNIGAPTATGFTITTAWNTLNTPGGTWIYYAHA